MLEVRHLKKTYKTKGGVDVHALDDVSIIYPEKGLVFLLGKSGSGKSTLLNVTGGLDKPDSGEIIVKGRSSKEFTTSDFDSYRNTFIGFIFQEYNILNEFNVEQNIALALQLQGKKSSKEDINKILEQVDLKGLNKRKPNTLSGGQKQRIAIARALIKSPEIIMADEPTGALDSNTGKQVFDTLKKLSEDKLVIVVSHDRDFAEQYGDRIIELKDGKIISDESKNFKEPVKVSENVQVVNDNTISIKHGKELSDKDMKEIAKILKNSDGEVVITSGDKNVFNTKKAIHLNDEGSSEVFLPTEEKKSSKTYTAEEAKFLKSKMPFKSSFKMGASGLKTKPVRLVFTILLSIISFTMFGVVSTFMMYNPSYTIADALRKSANDYEQITKSAEVKGHSESVDFETEEVVYSSTYDTTERVRFGKAEISTMNNNNVGHKYAGVISFSSWGGDSGAASLQVATGDDRYYSCTKLSGFVDAGESYLSENGFRKLAGTYPTAKDEIAISSYDFNVLKHDTELGLTDAESSILGKSIKVYLNGSGASYQIDLKVTGVYDFGQIPSKFDTIKNDSEFSRLDSKTASNLVNEFGNYISKSYHALGYVAPEFYEENFDRLYHEYSDSGTSTIYLRGVRYGSSPSIYEEPADENWGNSFYVDSWIKDNLSSFTFYDAKGNEVEHQDLTKHQVYLPYRYYSEAQRDAYHTYLSNVWNILNGSYSNIYPALKVELAKSKNIEGVDVDYKTLYKSAIQRLQNAGGKESGYPSGYSYEEDKATIETFVTKFYEEAMRRAYIYDFASTLRWSSAVTDPENVTYVTNYNKIQDGTDLSADTFTYFDDLFKNDETFKELVKSIVIYKSADYLRGNLKDEAERQAIISIIDKKSSYELSASEIATLKTIIDRHNKDGRYDVVYDSSLSHFENKVEPEFISTLYFKNYLGTTGELEVIGYCKVGSSDDDYGNLIVSKEFATSYTKHEETVYRSYKTSEYERPSDERYFTAITKTAYTEAQVSNLRASGNGYHYELTNPAYMTVATFITLVDVLQTVFLIVGLVMGGFAALMFANFISVSISNKKKEIGILRAVGARGKDVFKIFYSESFIIAAICVVISIISSAFTCVALNSELQQGMGVTALNFGILNVAIIIGVALVVSVLSTFVPVLLASRKPPVEAIRAL